MLCNVTSNTQRVAVVDVRTEIYFASPEIVTGCGTILLRNSILNLLSSKWQTIVSVCGLSIYRSISSSLFSSRQLYSPATLNGERPFILFCAFETRYGPFLVVSPDCHLRGPNVMECVAVSVFILIVHKSFSK